MHNPPIVRLINLSSEGEGYVVSEIRERLVNWWGHVIFEGSGEGSADCDAIVVVGGDNPFTATIGKGKVIYGRSPDDLVDKIVTAVFQEFVAGHQGNV